MGENVKVNERCIKANTSYYKIKISDIIKYEIDKLGADEASYQKFNFKISEKLSKFTEKTVSGGDFTAAITNLRDEIITECVEVDEKSNSKMRPFFKDYIFDKIYTMGINIKKGLLPEDYEQTLEEERLKIEEENKLKEEQEKETTSNEINITIEDEVEEKDADIVDQMWNYFFGGTSSTVSKKEEQPKKVEDELEEKENDIKVE
ncbi:MAG: hypothetical protein K0R72_298 [Clostridia bacterium]|jgi:hypothetical protein|nr:hypothetical protein [Clostridia bacterium]